ncbi:hypothetical protein ACNRWW_12690 [Metabacillus sp. HB246100]
MCYIIDQASLLKSNGTIKKTSLLIKKNKIEFMKTSLDNYRFMRMDMSSYLLTPGHVMVDFFLQFNQTYHEFKQLMIEKYLKKGCTALITSVEINNEKELAMKLKQRRHLMINSPIDYYVGVKIPFKLLTPSFLRKCRKEQLSVVFIDITEEDYLYEKSWGWIRDAMFSNPITLIPYLNEETMPLANRKKILENWVRLMEEHRLSSVVDTLQVDSPLSISTLMKVGIYPRKGDIRIGGQVNYNLYLLDDIRYYTDGRPKLDYKIHLPIVTAHQGEILNINRQITFKPGVGEECFIPISGRFMPHSASF